MNRNIDFNTQILPNTEHELNLGLASKNLDEFNKRTEENFRIAYIEQDKKFIRVSHDTRYKHYFDTYCLGTINWFIMMRNQPEIQKWIDEKIYSSRMFENFSNNRLHSNDEARLFVKLFQDFTPYAEYLSVEQGNQLKEQLNELCELAADYI